MSHGDYVIKPPVGFKTYANSPTCNHVIIGDDKRKIYAVQFHPEVSHTMCGTTILENFIKNICGVKNKS
jgi:GMP synthase (glutamine-hydrolysing)